MAVFFSVVETVDASPYNLLLSFYCPCASAVWRSAFSAFSAFSADEQFGQSILARIFALLCFGADLLDLSFSGAPFQFFLNSAEGAGVDDSRMIILHVVFLSFAVIDLDRFAYAVCDISLIDNCIALILFIREN